MAKDFGEYESGSIGFVDALRKESFGYGAVADLLHREFADDGTVVHVLELGCGTGSNLFALCSLGDYTGVGTDRHQDSIDIATARAEAARVSDRLAFRCQDFQKELPQGRFDAILLLFVPLSASAVRALLSRAESLLRPGGLVASVFLGWRDAPPRLGSSDHIIEFSETEDGQPVVLFGFYRVIAGGDLGIQYDGVYLGSDGERATLSRQRDFYPLSDPSSGLDLPPDRYTLLRRTEMAGSDVAPPPFTRQIFEAYRYHSDITHQHTI